MGRNVLVPTVTGVSTQEKSWCFVSRFRRKLRGTTGHRLMGTQRPQMLWVAAWVWFSLSTEFVVVPLARSGLVATGGDDIPARPAWLTSSTTRIGDWGVVKQIDAGAHPSSTGQTCPSMALHPSHAMSTASVPGPDSIAANLGLAPIASAPTLHDVTAIRSDLMAWLLHLKLPALWPVQQTDFLLNVTLV